jgi:Polysaccharide lyase
LFTAAAPVPARALATSSATSAASPRAGILYFDGRARTMRTLYSTSTTNQAQSPRVWSCLCFMNNDIQLATDSEFGQVYLTRAEPGSHNPWNTAAPTNAAAAQLSTVRESYGLGNTYWYGIAFKLDSSWSQPDWATLVTVGYPTLSSGPIDIDVYPINGSLSYILYMNSGLLTANTSGFFKGSVFSHTQIAPVVSGKWVEIILGIKWATNNTGSVNAYYRLEGQHSWKHPISKTHLATAQYGATSYGTVGPDGKNSDGSKRSVLDKQGLYYGFWSSATTSFATRSVYESGLTRSSSFARAASTLP